MEILCQIFCCSAVFATFIPMRMASTPWPVLGLSDGKILAGYSSGLRERLKVDFHVLQQKSTSGFGRMRTLRHFCKHTLRRALRVFYRGIIVFIVGTTRSRPLSTPKPAYIVSRVRMCERWSGESIQPSTSSCGER